MKRSLKGLVIVENYGNGQSTSIERGAIDSPTTGLTPEDLRFSQKEKDTLTVLAERVANIAGSNRMTEILKLWTDHNMLEKTRPVVFCDPENGRNEILTDAEALNQ